jgi:hypothetical protein
MELLWEWKEEMNCRTVQLNYCQSPFSSLSSSCWWGDWINIGNAIKDHWSYCPMLKNPLPTPNACLLPLPLWIYLPTFLPVCLSPYWVSSSYLQTTKGSEENVFRNCDLPPLPLLSFPSSGPPRQRQYLLSHLPLLSRLLPTVLPIPGRTELNDFLQKAARGLSLFESGCGPSAAGKISQSICPGRGHSDSAYIL